jgi:hypothetical protein
MVSLTTCAVALPFYLTQFCPHNKQEQLVVCIGSKGRLREHRCLTMKGDK